MNREPSSFCLAAIVALSAASSASHGESFAIRNWSLNGPFPADSLEEALEPDEVDPSHPETSGTLSREWQTHHSLGGWVDLSGKTAFGPLEQVSGYARVVIESPQEIPVRLTTFADDALQVWWNGIPVLVRRHYEDWPPRSDSSHLVMEEGRNVLLLKIVNRYGGWGFQAVLESTNGEELPEFTCQPPRAYLQALPVAGFSSSSVEAGDTRQFGPGNAFDGNRGTRWSSEHTDPQWIVWTLHRATAIERIRVRWENAYARTYEVQILDSSDRWRPVFRQEGGRGGEEWLDISPSIRASKWRLYCETRGTQWGNSIWEIECFGILEPEGER